MSTFNNRRWTLMVVLLASVGLGCNSTGTGKQHLADCNGSECQGRVNLPMTTLGGMQFWADVTWDRDWRIQRHVWSGHHRLLDPDNVRQAWGNLEECELRLNCARVGLAEQPAEHLVVLLHGLGRTRFSMNRLAGKLRASGLEVACLSYPSTRESIEEHADHLEQLLSQLEGVHSVSFVTHSLGGIVVRELSGREELWNEQLELERVVMIGPPNQRVQLAEWFATNTLFRLIAGPTGRQLARGDQAKMPIPAAPTLIVAGGSKDMKGFNPLIVGDDDGVVAVCETRLDGARHLLAHGLHTTLMNREEVVAAAVAFLSPGVSDQARQR